METQNLDQPEIDAFSCTLKTLFDSNRAELKGFQELSIPIYQRPYSWEEPQIRRFLQSILEAFQAKKELSNLNSNSSGETIFMGTLLLKRKDQKALDLIDGQQRMTTFMLLFRLLQFKNPKLEIPAPFQDQGWLSTQINLGHEQKQLEKIYEDDILSKVLDLPNLEETEHLTNRYLKGLHQLKTSWGHLFKEDSKGLNIPKLIDFILNHIYFVSIFTQTSLSKTLNIFDTINTTGMALNTGDIFKVRMYEYLTQFHPVSNPEEVHFNRINRLYSRIDQLNKEKGWNCFSISKLLTWYQWILIERDGKIKRSNHQSGYGKFWDELFRVILMDEKISGFDTGNWSKILSMDTLEKLLDAQIHWYETSPNVIRTVRCYYYTHLIHISRYARFWPIAIVFLYQFPNCSSDQLTQFNSLLSRYYFFRSIWNARIVNAGKTFSYNLIRKIIAPNSNPQASISFLKSEMDSLMKNHTEELKSHLKTDMYSNRVWAQLLCWLSLKLKAPEGWDSWAMKNNYWKLKMDVEHIHPRNPKFKVTNEEEWKPLLNSLGNLVLLESKINQKVKNKTAPEKWRLYRECPNKQVKDLKKASLSQEEKNKYQGSFSPSVKDLLKNYPSPIEESKDHKEWSSDQCKKRRNDEVQMVIDFLDGSLIPPPSPKA